MPKDMAGNLAYRAALLDYGSESPEHAADIWIMASRDILWTFNALFWTHDPRRVEEGEEPELPFITWDYQDETILWLHKNMGRQDMLIEKSREMGATWICIGAFFWQWLFKRSRHFLLVSWVKDKVEMAGDPDTLFWKIDFLLDHLPPFLVPRHTDTDMEMTNIETGSSIVGASTTDDVARGGRKTAILLDEFGAFGIGQSFRVLGSTQSVTNCRIFNSTHKDGEMGAFYAVSQTRVTKKRIMWWQHPLKRKGLYASENGKFVPLDPGFEYEKDPEGKPISYSAEKEDGTTVYQPFLLDGKQRSPWYDRETIERLANNPTLIARELDCNPKGSATLFFEGCEEVLKRDYALPPFHVGELRFDTEGTCIGFEECNEGRLRLWIHPNAKGEIPGDDAYIIGSDVSAGTGASNSTHCVYSARTGEKVAEYVDPHIGAETHAQLGVALARWFSDAYMVWDATGGFGRIFSDMAYDELGYRNVHMRTVTESRPRRKTTKPGFCFGGDIAGRVNLLGAYKHALITRKMINRSELALDECGRYSYGADGFPVSSRERGGDVDPSGARYNHGDLVIADALACLGLKERPYAAEVAPTKIPVGSLAWRIQLAKDADREAEAEEDRLI